jgi:nucleoside-diphosphate-sugar epimerase
MNLDALNREALDEIVHEREVDTIYHMASILSATGERMPQTAWNLNMNSLINVLEVGRKHNVERIIWPSSIAAFGPSTPREKTPNDTILRPTTMYGITKVAGELLVEYYFKTYGLDTRSMRLPGIISSETLPGGGTTDYAVEIFYEAIKHKKYTCFVKEATMLPMMYMPDCIKSHIDLAEADASKLKHRVFNVAGMSFTAGELAAEIKKTISEFKIEYKPDFRQQIADSWPRSIDDSCAREEWGWNPGYDLAAMTRDMIKRLRKKLK